MNFSKQRAHVIATAALCVLVVALAIGVIGQLMAASRLSGDIQEQKQLLTKSRQDLKDRAKWRNDYSDLSLKLGGRMSTCSWSDQMPFMMAQVTGIVDANGLKVESLQPEPMTSSGSIQRFPMRLGFQTDLQHLTRVMKDMRSSVPLMDIERLDIRNAQGETGKLQINLTVASFVVLDKNSPVARRRAVVPVKTKEKATEDGKSDGKPEAKPEARTESISEAKSQVKQPERPTRKPESRPPVARPAKEPKQKPDASEHKRPERTESPRRDRPATENGGKAARTEVREEGKAVDTPAGVEPDMIRRVEVAPKGGPR